MTVTLVILFGAVVGLICHSIKGSGYSLWWDIMLGIAGYTMSSVAVTFFYLLYHFGRIDVIGINWYSLTIGSIGALTLIYGTLIYNRPHLMSKIGFSVVVIK